MIASPLSPAGGGTVALLSHAALIERAQHQRRLLSESPTSPAVPRSPTAYGTPMSPTMLGTPPEESPKYRRLATRLASSSWLSPGFAASPSRGAPPPGPPAAATASASPRAAARAASAEGWEKAEPRRQRLSGHPDDDFNLRLSVTKSSLRDFERRAERLLHVGSASPESLSFRPGVATARARASSVGTLSARRAQPVTAAAPGRRAAAEATSVCRSCSNSGMEFFTHLPCACAIGQAGAEAKRARAAEALAQENLAAREREHRVLKDDNTRLRGRVHSLEQELQGQLSSHGHLSGILRETREHKELTVTSLQHDLSSSEARLREAQRQLRGLQQDEASRGLQRRELEVALLDRSGALNRASLEHQSTKQECSEQLEQLKKHLSNYVQMAQEGQRQERTQREREYAACHAQLEASQSHCRDQQRAVEVMQESLAAARGPEKVLRDRDDGLSHLRTEHSAFSVDMQRVHLEKEAVERQLRDELGEAWARTDSLQEALGSRERRLQDAHGELGRVELYRDEAQLKHREVDGELARHSALLGDVSRSLIAVRAERDDLKRELATNKSTAEVERDRSARRVALLEGQLENAYRNMAQMRDTLEAHERRAAATEHRLRAALDEAQGLSTKSHAAQAENAELLHRAALHDQQRTEFEWQTKDSQDRHGQISASHVEEAIGRGIAGREIQVGFS